MSLINLNISKYNNHLHTIALLEFEKRGQLQDKHVDARFKSIIIKDALLRN